jgi:50S ribosomal protein L16 3-hydroxylase
MNAPLGDIDATTFLRDYWQKKPLLIRGAFPDFTPELDRHDMAGLACDDLAEARLVTGRFTAQDWSVDWGPFTDERLSSLPPCDWTLLVQDVEKHYPPLQDLLERFDFLPRWRMDDLMVSVAAPGGSVGPHVDQYDVFLLQAEGRRRWQISEQFDETLLPDCELKVLRSFVPEQEWDLETGDLLYLPPGIAHHGVALDACMTWSLGMRAPSAADLFQSLGEWLANTRNEGGRYADRDLLPPGDRGELDAMAIDRLRELADRMLQDTGAFNEFAGVFLSRYRLAHEPAGPDRAVAKKELWQRLAGGARLVQNPWTRLLWQRRGDAAVLFAAGNRYPCDIGTATALCDPARLAGEGKRLAIDQADLICRLIGDGHLYVDDEP